MAEKIIIQLEVDAKSGVATVKGLEKEINETGESVEKTSDAVSGLTNQLDKMTGGAVSAFKGMVTGAKSAIVALNGVKVAVAATGIGLLVLAVVSLTQAFTKSEEGQDKWGKVTGVLSAIVGSFTDLLANLGEVLIWVFENPQEAIKKLGEFLKSQIINRITGMLELIPALGEAISLVFQGKFTEAGEVAVNALGKVYLGVEDTIGLVGELIDVTDEYIERQKEIIELSQEASDMEAKANKLQRQFVIDREVAQNKINQLRLQARQEELFDAKQREEFARQASELQDGLFAKEQEILELRRDATVIRTGLSKSDKDALDAEAESIAAVLRLEGQRTAQARTDLREINRLRKENEAAGAAEVKARTEALEKIAAAVRTSNEQEVYETREKYAELIRLARQYGQDTLELEKQRRNALRALDTQEIDAGIGRLVEASQKGLQVASDEQMKRLQLKTKAQQEENKQEQMFSRIREEIAQDEAQARIMTYQTVLQSFAMLAGQQTATGKALAIAAATISTYTAAAKAIEIYGPTPLGYAGLAAALATGFAQVRNIMQVQVPFGGGVGMSSPSLSAPSLGNSIGIVNPNQQGSNIGDNIGAQLRSQPMRAYVVSEDIRSGLDLDNRIRSNGQFG
jgi:hypothetical protein